MEGMLGIVCIGALASGLSTVTFRRRHRRSLAAAHYLVVLLGATAAIGGIGHLIGVTASAAGRGALFHYDFRTHSLWCLGAVLLAAGAGLIRAAHQLGDRAAEAARRATRLGAALAALTIPLIPILAPPAAVLSSMSLGIVVFLRVRSHQWQA